MISIKNISINVYKHIASAFTFKNKYPIFVAKKNKDSSVEDIYGRKLWYIKKDDEYILHRVDGPAIYGIGGEEHWYHMGELHRIDGPALTFPGPPKEECWYLNNKKVKCKSQKEFEKLLKLKVFW